MDFHLTKEQLLVRKMYREFAENEVKLWPLRSTKKSVSPWKPSRRWQSWA